MSKDHDWLNILLAFTVGMIVGAGTMGMTWQAAENARGCRAALVSATASDSLRVYRERSECRP